MDEIIIGLFLGLLTRLIRNPQHAATLRHELLHIRDGINAMGLEPIVAPITAEGKHEQK